MAVERPGAELRPVEHLRDSQPTDAVIAHDLERDGQYLRTHLRVGFHLRPSAASHGHFVSALKSVHAEASKVAR